MRATARPCWAGGCGVQLRHITVRANAGGVGVAEGHDASPLSVGSNLTGHLTAPNRQVKAGKVDLSGSKPGRAIGFACLSFFWPGLC